ncbi:MAG: hypothetical protein ACR2HX_07975 [Pyrinomonadaceae bacterium]
MPDSGSDVGLVAAVEHAQLFEVREHRYGRVTVPAVANCLKIKVGVVYPGMRFLSFDVKTHVAEVGRQESIIRAFAPFIVATPRSTLTSCL